MTVLLAKLHGLYFQTLRVEVILPCGTRIHPREYPFSTQLFAHCERSLLALTYFFGWTRFAVLVAEGRDGDWACEVLCRLGAVPIRGSSLRGGGRGLRQLLSILEDWHYPAAISVDGPLGPAGSVKPGVFLCAAKTGRPIVPVAAWARPCLTFPATWSGIFLPLPFARLRVALGESRTLAEFGETVDRQQLSRWLSLELDRIQNRAAHA